MAFAVVQQRGEICPLRCRTRVELLPTALAMALWKGGIVCHGPIFTMFTSRNMRMRTPSVQKVGLSLLAACGVFQTVLGLYFLQLRPTLLPEDERFIGLSLDALTRIAPGLTVWLDRVFVVLGGHAMATGLLTLLAAILLWQSQRPPRTAVALVFAAGLVSVVLMSAINFAIYSDFRWLLLVPALAWTIAVLLLGVNSIGREVRDSSN